MGFLDRAVVGMKVRAFQAGNVLKAKLQGDQTVVVAMILIAVAVGLCIIFRNYVNVIMENVANQVSNTVNCLVNGVVKNPGDIGG